LIQQLLVLVGSKSKPQQMKDYYNSNKSICTMVEDIVVEKSGSQERILGQRKSPLIDQGSELIGQAFQRMVKEEGYMV
jgi:hypothetical protein